MVYAIVKIKIRFVNMQKYIAEKKQTYNWLRYQYFMKLMIMST